MGGTIKVASRLHDGSITADTRWTNNMPTLFEHLDFFNDIPEHLRKYMEMPSDYRSDDNTVSPTVYGLVLIDAITHTIYSGNGYSTPGNGDVVTIKRRSANDAADATFWETLMRRGRLSVLDLKNNVPIKGYEKDCPLSVIEESARLYKLENNNKFYTTVRIDMSPWTVKRFNDTPNRDMLRAIIDDGFPLTPEDLAAWETWFKEKKIDG